MGRRVEKTVDLGMDRLYQVEISPRHGLVIGKVHGIGARGNQEDAFGISDTKDETVLEKGVLLILSDGMGGLCDGEKASAATVIACLNYFDNHEMEHAPWEHFHDMAQEANEQVKEALGKTAGAGGATLIAAWIKDQKVYWASVGDSHLYLFREEELHQLNQEHTYGATLDRMAQNGEITQAEAAKNPSRRALTSFIGADKPNELDWNEKELTLQKGDRFLLMSDGVFGTLTKQEITDAMQYPADKSAKHLEMQIESKKKRNQDNYTAIIVEVIG
ncbi:MAG: serine/threonine-protein phosphatase [Lachnospiraceae bacterium]|jgi:serine/threonine protein phosphatase PrpC|nr:serine/threonine-protein phosphatase [Lachnospiraceae bacterium]